MIFGFPMAFWFAGVMLVAAAVFFYKRKSREVVVPAVRDWLLLGRPVDAHSWKSLLRRLATLLLQLLVIFLLVMALADPAAEHAARRVVLVVDVGATMQARETGGARLELARARAMEIARAVPRDGEVIILAAGQATMLALPAGQRHRAGEVLETLAAVDVESDVPGALRAAKAYVDPHTPTEVVVLSDFAGVRGADLWRGWAADARLKLIQVGKDAPSAAVTAVWSEPEGTSRRITARIEHREMNGRRMPARLLIGGAEAQRKDVTLETAATLVTFEHAAPGGAKYEVAIDTGDPLSADDHAYGVMPRREGVAVLLVSRGNWPLETALRAEASADIRVTVPEAYDGPRGAGVVVVDNVQLPATDKTAAGYLFIQCGDPFGASLKSKDVESPAVTHWSGDHPVMVDLDPTLVSPRLAAFMEWRGGRPREILAADRVPLIVEFPPAAKVGERKSIYWLFDPRESGLVRRPGFPLLLWNTIDYLSGARDESADTQATGQPIKLRATSRPAVRNPRGRVLPSREVDGAWIVTDTLVAGHYEDGSAAHAVSLLSTRGILPLASPEELRGQGDGPVMQAGFLARLMGMLRRGPLLLVACLLMLTDWLLFHRGKIRIG